ncbi:MAG TPA: AMP-binding protein, partial [Bacteroidales bacterium]|nr:AMP-binding protein [Bacteroidales bacterium]
MDTIIKVPFVTIDTLIALLENNVLNYGSRPAIQTIDVVLSYEEFYKRVLLLSYNLAEKGCRPQQRVGILMERSLEMVTGIFGILKFGCSYVPTDPSYPDSRIRGLLLDAEVTHVVTSSYYKDRIE